MDSNLKASDKILDDDYKSDFYKLVDLKIDLKNQIYINDDNKNEFKYVLCNEINLDKISNIQYIIFSNIGQYTFSQDYAGMCGYMVLSAINNFYEYNNFFNKI